MGPARLVPVGITFLEHKMPSKKRLTTQQLSIVHGTSHRLNPYPILSPNRNLPPYSQP